MFTVLTADRALAPNMASLAVLRFLCGMAGSAGPALEAGTISDVFAPERRGRAHCPGSPPGSPQADPQAAPPDSPPDSPPDGPLSIRHLNPNTHLENSRNKYEHKIVKEKIRDVNRAIITIREFLRPHLKRIPNESNLAFQNDYHATTPMATTLMATTLMATTPMPGHDYYSCDHTHDYHTHGYHTHAWPWLPYPGDHTHGYHTHA